MIKYLIFGLIILLIGFMILPQIKEQFLEQANQKIETDCQKYNDSGFDTRLGFKRFVIGQVCFLNINGYEYTSWEYEEALKEKALKNAVEEELKYLRLLS